MVVISLPAASATRLTHDRIASPFRWTVQAPHCAMPQPYLVPVSESVSRSTQSKGVPGSTSTFIVLPLTLRVINGALLFVQLKGAFIFEGCLYARLAFRLSQEPC